MGRIFPFITMHECRVGRSLANRYHLGAFLSAPWLGVKYYVARTQAFVWEFTCLGVNESEIYFSPYVYRSPLISVYDITTCMNVHGCHIILE